MLNMIKRLIRRCMGRKKPTQQVIAVPARDYGPNRYGDILPNDVILKAQRRCELMITTEVDLPGPLFGLVHDWSPPKHPPADDPTKSLKDS